MRFKIYSWVNDMVQPEAKPSGKELYCRTPKGYQAMVVNPAEVSPEYEGLLTDGSLVFYKRTEVDGEQAYTPVAETPVPAGAEQLFIYHFAEGDKNKVLAVDTSLRSFPMGQFVFLNTTEQPVILSINGKAIGVKPRSRGKMKYAISSKGTLRIEVKSTDKPQKLLAVMTVGGRSEQRIIGFFHAFRDGKTHRLLLERGVDRQADIINRD
ncbi:hypothetical protein [Oceaniferula spumae]|uniref:hypothetical protein n=1 Tax=Oceaniferula spumae TaxID=2979115 RepID=UPI003F4EAC83